MQETKSNAASATDHSSSVFVLSAPEGAEAADSLLFHPKGSEAGEIKAFNKY